MLKKKIETVSDVVSWRMCMGCGACAYACPNRAITLEDIFAKGIRPKVDQENCQTCGDCIKVCPGIGFCHDSISGQTIVELRQAWGPVLEVLEGFAVDSEIRLKGSSGGIATAMALYCLEKGKASSVLHIGTKEGEPLSNSSVFSKDRQSLIFNSGSRYAPAAACEKFDWIANSEGKCVFIGKPCDVAALRKAQKLYPILKEKVILAISIFCAGTPSTEGTHKVLESLNVNSNQVDSFRYRGHGWPGMTIATLKEISDDKKQMTYAKSWGTILCNHVGLRCRLCPDGTGEFADISCGDPWYMELDGDDPGQSLILIRTEQGKKLFHEAIQCRIITADNVEPNILPASQRWLFKKRLSLWGRLTSLRLMCIPAPKYEGFSLFHNWLELSFSGKIQSLTGTISRSIKRKWNFRDKTF